MRKTINYYIILLCSLLIWTSCKQPKQEELAVFQVESESLLEAPLIPKPLDIEPTLSAFPLHENVELVGDEKFNQSKEYLTEQLQKQFNIELQGESKENFRKIYFIDTLIQNNEEAYMLDIKHDSIKICAQPKGSFYAVQTLLQIVKNKRLTLDNTASYYPIATGLIVDKPKLAYRSAMLDVARHFFSVDEVKKYIDILAYYKFNHFHLHLTDDQGWRIAINNWPKLTEVGAEKEVGGTDGGFYTQEEFKDIVSYANARYITIIPEIDMPGHTNAASYSYPVLDGTGEPLSYYTGMRVGFSGFNTHSDSTYIFVRDVIQQVNKLANSPYFHIGGDESHSTAEKDYVHFVNKVKDIIKQEGKTLIGWEEIGKANVDQNDIVQLWRNQEGVKQAIAKGAKFILSPSEHIYLDMKYNENSKHGLTWAGFSTVEDAYNWLPLSYGEIPKDKIIGIEAPLWSETISNSEELEYLAIPRLIGVAELAWTKESLLNWDNYKQRLAKQTAYFKRANVSYYDSSEINWVK